MPSTDNKRVAKNALALTIRMILVTIVGLFTSRIVLQALGVENYGIYGVIGGVVGMASFLNTSMAGATSRFITFELGCGNSDKLRKIFSTALIIHVIIAIVVTVLAETIGLWFVNNKMNFPEGRMTAVNILYQFTIISMFVSFTQVPYTAMIMAYEKMNIYAYFEIINVILKLLIVYLLLVVSSDRLILYAALTLAVSILSALIYRYYCIRNFKEAKFKFVRDKIILKKMLSFSGLDLYRNMCVVARNQSQPIILNMFFGVVANAGSSVAYTLTGAIGGLTGSIASAFKPQIVKQYSINQIDGMTSVMRRSAQFTLLAYSLLALPMFIEIEQILYLWLGQVPAYSVEFLRLIIVTAFFYIVINTNETAIHATGNIKKLSLYTGTLLLFSPFISYIVLKYWITDAGIVYLVNIVISVFVVTLEWYLIKIQIPGFRMRKYAFSILRSWCSIGVSFLIVIMIRHFVVAETDLHEFSDTILTISLVIVVSVVVLTSLSILIALNSDEVVFLRGFVIHRIKNICKA